VKLLFGLPLVLSFMGCFEVPSIIDSAPEEVYTVFHWTVTDRETQAVLGADCDSAEDSPCNFQFAAVPGQKVTVSVRLEAVRKNQLLSNVSDHRAYLCSTEDDKQRYAHSVVSFYNQCTVVKGDDPPATIGKLSPSNPHVSGDITEADGYDMDLDVLRAGALHLNVSQKCDPSNPVADPSETLDTVELVILNPGQANCSPFNSLSCGGLPICPGT
jgi:hypothetical protein